MATKSQPHNRGRDEVYQWIEHLQKEPKDEEIQEKIVLTYKDLVSSIARKYSKNSAIHEDLVQVGMIGLLAAVRRYDQRLASHLNPLQSQQSLVKSNDLFVIRHGAFMYLVV